MYYKSEFLNPYIVFEYRLLKNINDILLPKQYVPLNDLLYANTLPDTQSFFNLFKIANTEYLKLQKSKYIKCNNKYQEKIKK